MILWQTNEQESKDSLVIERRMGILDGSVQKQGSIKWKTIFFFLGGIFRWSWRLNYVLIYGCEFPPSSSPLKKVVFPHFYGLSYQTHHGGHFKLSMTFCSTVKQ